MSEGVEPCVACRKERQDERVCREWSAAMMASTTEHLEVGAT